jgi:3-deoxy-manno-octulosonate cytidylyltransferase (CMP-KDO synthetase)
MDLQAKVSEARVIGIIPARMGSTRFPGKPLAPIAGVPMVGHVYLRSKMCERLEQVYVATPDSEIVRYIESIGGEVVLTAPTHERASDRTEEAAAILEQSAAKAPEIVVMIQGDEPLITPELIDRAIAPLLADPEINVANLMAPIRTREEHQDPNEIKVVVNRDSFALYFSRSPIPSLWRSAEGADPQKQVCVIPFRTQFLHTFAALEPTPLEKAESIDMLRVLEHGMRVKMVPIDSKVYSVDTEQDRQHVESLMLHDPYWGLYKGRAQSFGA